MPEAIWVTRPVGRLAEQDERCRVEWVSVTVEDCARRRWRTVTDEGTDIAIDLPLDEWLEDGLVLYRDDLRVIVVRVLPVSVLTARPKSLDDMGRLAYLIGNLHQPCLIHHGEIVVPDDAALTDLFTQAGLPYQREQRVLPRGFDSVRRSSHHGQHE